MVQVNGYPVNAETPIELQTDSITPTELFFVRSHWIPHTPTLRTWHLTIDGEVEKLAQLTSPTPGSCRMPSHPRSAVRR